MLQARRRLTAALVAERFGVSLRTVYRDIRSLVDAGLPIDTIQGVGYRLAPGYTLPPVSLTPEELAALVAAGKLLEKGRDRSLATDFATALEKITAVLPGRSQRDGELLRERTYVYPRDHTIDLSDGLGALQRAIVERRRVQFDYHSRSKDEHTARAVDPYAVYQAQGNWVLVGHCHLRENIREFRLDRLSALHLRPERFDPPDFDLVRYFRTNMPAPSTPDIGPSLAPLTLRSSPNPTTVQTTQHPTPKTICGIAVRTDNSSGAAGQDIPALWGRFAGEQLYQSIPNPVDAALYCVYAEYEGDHTQPYTCLLGMEVPAGTTPPEGMRTIELPAGDYAKFETRGDLTKGIVFAAWMDIWARPLTRAYGADYERYAELPADASDVGVEIFVGITQFIP